MLVNALLFVIDYAVCLGMAAVCIDLPGKKVELKKVMILGNIVFVVLLILAMLRSKLPLIKTILPFLVGFAACIVIVAAISFMVDRKTTYKELMLFGSIVVIIFLIASIIQPMVLH